MISLTRLNGEKITLNAELIETVESRPDTLIILTTGNRIMVKEKAPDVVSMAIEYRRLVNMLSREDIKKIITEETE